MPMISDQAAAKIAPLGALPLITAQLSIVILVLWASLNNLLASLFAPPVLSASMLMNSARQIVRIAPRVTRLLPWVPLSAILVISVKANPIPALLFALLAILEPMQNLKAATSVKIALLAALSLKAIRVFVSPVLKESIKSWPRKLSVTIASLESTPILRVVSTAYSAKSESTKTQLAPKNVRRVPLVSIKMKLASRLARFALLVPTPKPTVRSNAKSAVWAASTASMAPRLALSALLVNIRTRTVKFLAQPVKLVSSRRPEVATLVQHVVSVLSRIRRARLSATNALKALTKTPLVRETASFALMDIILIRLAKSLANPLPLAHLFLKMVLRPQLFAPTVRINPPLVRLIASLAQPVDMPTQKAVLNARSAKLVPSTTKPDYPVSARLVASALTKINWVKPLARLALSVLTSIRLTKLVAKTVPSAASPISRAPVNVRPVQKALTNLPLVKRIVPFVAKALS
jgi:hypothetical protein